jgi:putative ABC transport system permease protein
MNIESLSAFDLGLAALLVLALGIVQFLMGLGLQRSLVIGTIRMTLQLLLVGLVLKALFESAHLVWIGLMALVMLGLAG